MNVLLVSNPASGGADDGSLAEIRDVLARIGPVSSAEPPPAKGRPRTLEGVHEAELVAVAGGDGTVNCTLNALGERLEEVALALIPMGTGNDLARTLGLPLAPTEAAEVAIAGSEREIDLCRASGRGVQRLFLNACLGGFPVDVDAAVEEGDLKRRLGPLAFWAGGVKAAADLERFAVTAGEVEARDCIAVGVGNGRTAGGGIEVWPNADPSDGMLDVCLLPASGALDAARLAAKVRGGSHADIEEVKVRRAARVTVAADPDMEFNVDGELVGLTTPVDFEVVGRVRVRTTDQ